jgi:hypothetical protein
VLICAYDCSLDILPRYPSVPEDCDSREDEVAISEYRALPVDVTCNTQTSIGGTTQLADKRPLCWADLAVWELRRYRRSRLRVFTRTTPGLIV